ncbi:MAG TPA: DUF885 family protein [Labilithrix sp.]|nr:DUF885 family protein [Labilithrix sp.]
MRQAHAFLDIELNIGNITPSEAFRVMRDEVAMSDAWAKLCVERYTTRMPGHAPSYFYGYTRLLQIRAEAERAMGAQFQSREFHRFVLAQGPLPLEVLRGAVARQFVRGFARSQPG